MNLKQNREWLEYWQIVIYFVAIITGVVIAVLFPSATLLESGINPAIAFMLFVTFLQVPISDLMGAFVQFRFLAALLIANFLIIPLLVMFLVKFIPSDSMVQLGVLLVLLTPCIDYVVTFSNIGKANAYLLLAATPILLLIQLLMLPLYLSFFLEENTTLLIQTGPFVNAFIWLIAVPLVLAISFQLSCAKSKTIEKVSSLLGVLPVPATALLLFLVSASVVPQLKPAINSIIEIVPIYLAFSIISPLVGWFVAHIFQLDVSSTRAIAFSTATRNSLVVLPLAFAVPNATPILPAVIVTQTLIELISELVYIRIIPKVITHKN